MSVLEHLAQAAAVILLVELLVVLTIFLAVSGGLVFGLRWTRGKTSWALGKVNTYTGLGQKYISKGADYAALPVILAGRTGGQMKGMLDSIEEQVRRVRVVRHTAPPVAARPVPPPPEEAEAPDVLV